MVDGPIDDPIDVNVAVTADPSGAGHAAPRPADGPAAVHRPPHPAPRAAARALTDGSATPLVAELGEEIAGNGLETVEVGGQHVRPPRTDPRRQWLGEPRVPRVGADLGRKASRRSKNCSMLGS